MGLDMERGGRKAVGLRLDVAPKAGLQKSVFLPGPRAGFLAGRTDRGSENLQVGVFPAPSPRGTQ